MNDSASTPAGAAVAALPATWPALSLAQANALLSAPGARFETQEAVIRGVRTTVWKNCPPTLREVFLASRAFQDRTFVVYEDERVTFAAFQRAVLALARELTAQGVRKGDRVALAMRNLPEWPVALFASALCGAIATPLNAWWSGPELEYGLTNAGAKVAFVDDERYQRLAAHWAACRELERVYICRRAGAVVEPRCVLLESVLGAAAHWSELPECPLPQVALEPDDDAMIVYTSGTTGKAKGALITHRNVTTGIMTIAAASARTLLRRGVTPPDPATLPQRATLLSIPLFHVIGCNASLVPTVFSGGKLVMMHKWEVTQAFELIEREAVVVTGGVPTIVWQLLEHPERARYNLSSLESLAYGGAPSAPELVRRIAEVFPQAQATNGWGMTETAGSFCSNTAEDYISRPTSCGPAPLVGAVRIMSADGSRELPCGEIGELWVKGPMVVKGYWNDAPATARTFVDGWLKTGDVARLDAEGFCHIVDRVKDMLIRGGENIYCSEVENVLYEHPAVMDAALVGLPHRTLGEEPAAVVQLKPGAAASEPQLRAWVAARLAAFKVPVKVWLHDGPLPRNAAGKILKAELKRALLAPAADQEQSRSS